MSAKEQMEIHLEYIRARIDDMFEAHREHLKHCSEMCKKVDRHEFIFKILLALLTSSTLVTLIGWGVAYATR